MNSIGESPIFPVPVPEIRGRGGDGDDPLKKIGDFLGTGMTSILGIFWGFIPENPQKKLGKFFWSEKIWGNFNRNKDGE